MVVNSGWLQNHIEHRRNPATDVVNLICARLKQELREDSVDQATRQRIERDLMPLGMNAVAAAMQTTG